MPSRFLLRHIIQRASATQDVPPLCAAIARRGVPSVTLVIVRRRPQLYCCPSSNRVRNA